MASSAASGLLSRQLKQMQSDKGVPGISCGLVSDNIFEWEVMLMISDDCKYYGGVQFDLPTHSTLPSSIVMAQGWLMGGVLWVLIGGFYRAHLTFPPEYPLLPPKMTFQSPIFHPNIYPTGDVCISILHAPTADPYGYEAASERWSPVQTPETILLSVISMLSSPNDESPANVEAARMWREDPRAFRRRCREDVRKSLGEE